jgi:hypothetical protein
MKAAPRRGASKRYFVGHSGETTSGAHSNRREEHLAIALWLAFRHDGVALPDGTLLFPIEYQLPLKSHNDALNAGIGKVDLLCVEASGQPWIGELKIHRAGESGQVETPVKALLEALAYCALVDADRDALHRESVAKEQALGKTVAASRPNLLVLATAEYWSACEEQEQRHPWKRALAGLCRRIESDLGAQTKFASLQGCAWAGPGLGDGAGYSKKPCLLGRPSFVSAL